MKKACSLGSLGALWILSQKTSADTSTLIINNEIIYQREADQSIMETSFVVKELFLAEKNEQSQKSKETKWYLVQRAEKQVFLQQSSLPMVEENVIQKLFKEDYPVKKTSNFKEVTNPDNSKRGNLSSYLIFFIGTASFLLGIFLGKLFSVFFQIKKERST